MGHDKKTIGFLMTIQSVKSKGPIYIVPLSVLFFVSHLILVVFWLAFYSLYKEQWDFGSIISLSVCTSIRIQIAKIFSSQSLFSVAFSFLSRDGSANYSTDTLTDELWENTRKNSLSIVFSHQSVNIVFCITSHATPSCHVMKKKYLCRYCLLATENVYIKIQLYFLFLFFHRFCELRKMAQSAKHKRKFPMQRNESEKKKQTRVFFFTEGLVPFACLVYLVATFA